MFASGSDCAEKHVDFVSIGTNDLTQLVFGFSRDDTQRFMPTYLEQHIMAKDPFVSLDVRGVGSLVTYAVNKCRKANPAIKVGVCGEHGGDPASIQFFNKAGLDYISCSPARVPIAKIAAAQAHIEDITRGEVLHTVDSTQIYEDLYFHIIGVTSSVVLISNKWNYFIELEIMCMIVPNTLKTRHITVRW